MENIPSSRPKRSDLYTLSQRKLLENHTLQSVTYLMIAHTWPTLSPGLFPQKMGGKSPGDEVDTWQYPPGDKPDSRVLQVPLIP